MRKEIVPDNAARVGGSAESATPDVSTHPATATATAPPGVLAATAGGNTVLEKMLDRLLAAVVNSPSLNCRPHHSRQRVDLAQLQRLGDLPPERVLERLLGKAKKVTVKARVPQPKRRPAARQGREGEEGQESKSPAPGASVPGAPGDAAITAAEAAEAAAVAAQSAAEKAWSEQNALLNKMHGVAEDARTYEQDTGVHVLNVGFPLLSLPPGSFAAAARGGSATRRVLAPIAFIPVTLTVKRGSPRSVELACRGEGVDLVTPNAALLSWIEQQTGRGVGAAESADDEGGEGGNDNGGPGEAREPFADEGGQDPWREVRELVGHVCGALDMKVPEFFSPEGETDPTPGPSDPDRLHGSEPSKDENGDGREESGREESGSEGPGVGRVKA